MIDLVIVSRMLRDVERSMDVTVEKKLRLRMVKEREILEGNGGFLVTSGSHQNPELRNLAGIVKQKV